MFELTPRLPKVVGPSVKRKQAGVVVALPKDAWRSVPIDLELLSCDRLERAMD